MPGFGVMSRNSDTFDPGAAVAGLDVAVMVRCLGGVGSWKRESPYRKSANSILDYRWYRDSGLGVRNSGLERTPNTQPQAPSLQPRAPSYRLFVASLIM